MDLSKDYKMSIESRQNISKAKIGENNPMFGVEPWNKGKKYDEEDRKRMGRKKGCIPWNKDVKKCFSEKTLEQIRANNKGKNNPQYGKCRELHWNWQGGISREPYCFEFTKYFKEEIKERDNYTCQNPTCWNKVGKLNVHHINYIKKDCNWRNLITLCASCNTRANTNRAYWQSLYSNIIKEKLYE